MLENVVDFFSRLVHYPISESKDAVQCIVAQALALTHTVETSAKIINNEIRLGELKKVV